VVATVGERHITAEELQRRLDEAPPMPRAGADARGPRREALEGLITSELLAQEALRRGLDKTPAVREATRRAMIDELLRQQLDEHREPTLRPDLRAGPLRALELVKLQSRAVAVDLTQDDVRELVRQRRAREQLTLAYGDFLQQLRARAHVKVDDAELARLSDQ
jgi:hypothetical protein